MGDSLISPIFLSLLLAFATTFILVGLGGFLAYLMVFKLRRFSVLLKVISNLPLVLPPTVLGFYFLMIFSPENPVGGFLAKLGISLNFSFFGLVVASVVFSLPFMVNPVLASIETLPGEYRDLGLIYRRSDRYIFWNLLLPHIKGGFLAGSVMAFAHTLGEFGVILMIGGNIPGKTRVASVEIFNLTMAMDFGNAHLLAALMVFISIITLSIFFGIIQRSKTISLW